MSDQKTPEISRRNFLGGVGTAAVGTAILATPGANLEAAQAKVPRWAMVMDLRRCIGCRACTVACKAENNVSLGRFRAVIQEVTTGTFPNTKKVFLPLMCNHCEGNEKDGIPPCVKACPEFPGERLKYKTSDGKTIRYRGGATFKRPDGLILVNKDLCIGCGKCIDACPYGVRSFDPFVKAFHGDLFADYLGKVRSVFKNVRAHSPEASRKASAETYIIAKRFRGTKSSR